MRAIIFDFDGVIIFVSDTVNRLTRTVMIRVMVENPDRKLKPDIAGNLLGHISDHPDVREISDLKERISWLHNLPYYNVTRNNISLPGCLNIKPR